VRDGGQHQPVVIDDEYLALGGHGWRHCLHARNCR
jgi:hypothetical protein